MLPGVALGLVVLAACGTDDAEGLGTLPPIRTTSTSSTTTTLFDDRVRLYTVKQGENLALIAERFEVPREFLINANKDKFDDPNNVQPGVILEIPPYVVVDELPATTVTTEAP